MALAAYRQLFRATRVAFGADLPILQASREQIREGFRNNRSLESPSPELDKAIEHAKGVAEVLRSNIVQGKKVEGEATYSRSAMALGCWLC